MNNVVKQGLVSTALACSIAISAGAHAQKPAAAAQPPTRGYKHKIPASILTSNKVQTRIGTLNFVDGVPTTETARKVYDNLDFMRGVEVFLNLMPAASLEALRMGSASIGVTKAKRDPRSLKYPNSQWPDGFVGSDYKWIDVRWRIRAQPGRAHELLLHGHREHAGDDREDAGPWLTVRPRHGGQNGHPIRRPQELSREHPDVPAANFWSVVGAGACAFGRSGRRRFEAAMRPCSSLRRCPARSRPSRARRRLPGGEAVWAGVRARARSGDL